MIAPATDIATKAIRPTHKEHRERVAMCRALLGKCVHDGDIKRIVAAKYGISKRSVERYLRSAREQMVAETGQPREVLQAESVEFYRTICQKKEAEDRDKIKARERIDKVLGLEAPARLEHSGRDGGPLTLAAILANAEKTAPPPAAETGNVIDVAAELAKVRASHGQG